MAKVQIKNEWKMWVGLGVVGLLIVLSLYYISRPPTEGGEPLWMVTGIIDGGTISVKGSGKEMKVSIIAIQTPKETEAQAKEYLTDELLNQWIRFKPIKQMDDNNQAGFVLISGEDMTARMIRQGLAKVDRDENALDVRTFIELEQEAKRAKRGLWANKGQGEK